MSQFNNTDNGSNPSEFRAPLPPPSSLSAASLIKSIRASKFSDISVNANNGSRPSVRKSKFSDKPPVAVPPPGVIATKAPKAGAVAAAAAAAARINANLKAKGKLSDETLQKPIVNANTTSPLALIKISETKKVFNSYIAKIDINDLPLSSRTYFTQVSFQETINKETGVAISTKGQYLTAEEKKHLEGIEKQLHLFVQSPSQEKTDMAVKKLKELISKQKIPATSNPSSVGTGLTLPPIKPIPAGQPTLPTGNFVQEKVFVGMDYCVSEFDLKTKLIGVNYTNFNFVANSTGAKVILRGKGSGFIEPTSGREAFESMYVFISHPNQAGVDAAKKLVYNLISTVHTEYNSFRTKKPNTQSSNFSASTKAYPHYPSSALPLTINTYGSMNMPATNAYGPNPYATPSAQLPTNPYAASAVPNSFYPAAAPVANPYGTTPPVVNPYGTTPPVVNPYGTTAPVAPAYNIPVCNTTNHTSAVSSHSSHTDNLNNDNKLPLSNTNEFKSKKRRFQEEQPDDSNLLGYKQFSAQTEDESKKARQNSEGPAKEYEEDQSASLPFWMSHK